MFDLRTNILSKIIYWYLAVLSLFYCSPRVFIDFVFHVLSLFGLCAIIVLFFMFFMRVCRILIKITYLLTYLMTDGIDE